MIVSSKDLMRIAGRSLRTHPSEFASHQVFGSGKTISLRGMVFCRDFEKRKYLLLHVYKECRPSNNYPNASCARPESMPTCFLNACSYRSQTWYHRLSPGIIVFTRGGGRSSISDSRLSICTTREAHRYFMKLNRECDRAPGANKMHTYIYRRDLALRILTVRPRNATGPLG